MHAIDVMLLNMIIVFLLLVMKTIHGCELKRKTEHNMQNKNESDLQGNHHDKRETESHYHDTTDYHIYVKCGSVEMYAGNKCHCGNITLHNIGLSDQYCCVDSGCFDDFVVDSSAVDDDVVGSFAHSDRRYHQKVYVPSAVSTQMVSYLICV